MFNLWQDPKLRPANTGDSQKLSRLLSGNSFTHRHLGWETPLSWLGNEPFYLLEKEGDIIAAFACPPDEDGICWLRLGTTLAGCNGLVPAIPA